MTIGKVCPVCVKTLPLIEIFTFFSSYRKGHKALELPPPVQDVVVRTPPGDGENNPPRDGEDNSLGDGEDNSDNPPEDEEDNPTEDG